jgi:transposase
MAVSYKILPLEAQTPIPKLFPPDRGICLTEVIVGDQSVQVQLTAMAPTALCPSGATPSSSVHSHYQRQLADLPWGSLAVRLQLLVRECVCRHVPWARRILTARLPDVAAPYARTSLRLVNALRALGIALGGQAGARLAAQLRLPPSPSPLLRRVRAAPTPHTPALQAIGVGEWAWRRGQRYGPILVDLVTPRVVGLLPDRAAATVAAWLAQHPTVIAVCRERRDLYAAGIRRGAPEAVPVVARFHPVQNLRQALEAFLIDHRSVRQAAAIRTAMALLPAHSPVPVMPMSRGRRRNSKPAPQEAAARPPRHARWVAVYAAVRTLRAQGPPIATTARQRSISRPTVYAYLRRDTPPGPRPLQRPPSARVLTPYVPSLIRRWRESGADSRPLWREMQALGYTHAARPAGRFITPRRRAADAGQPPAAQRSPYRRPQGPSARAVSFAMVCPAAKRSIAVQTSPDQRGQTDAGIARAYRLTQGFLARGRERRGADLETWRAEAISRGIDALARCTRGRQDDRVAVQAGLTLEWSNGVTEGQMQRLKLVKRQGYGRAGFTLIRQRGLHAA